MMQCVEMVVHHTAADTVVCTATTRVSDLIPEGARR